MVSDLHNWINLLVMIHFNITPQILHVSQELSLLQNV